MVILDRSSQALIETITSKVAVPRICLGYMFNISYLQGHNFGHFMPLSYLKAGITSLENNSIDSLA